MNTMQIKLLGRSIRSFRSDRRGSMSVEFAMIGAVLSILMLVAADMGYALWQKAQVANAARAGAEYAALHGWSSSSITSAAQNATALTVSVTPTTYCGCAGTSSVAQQTCGTNCSAGGTTGTYVSVTTQATYTPFSPVAWGTAHTNLSSTFQVRVN